MHKTFVSKILLKIIEISTVFSLLTHDTEVAVILARFTRFTATSDALMLTKKAGTKPAVQTPKKVACQSCQLAYALGCNARCSKASDQQNASPAK